jgi:hypothetical protein
VAVDVVVAVDGVGGGVGAVGAEVVVVWSAVAVVAVVVVAVGVGVAGGFEGARGVGEGVFEGGAEGFEVVGGWSVGDGGDVDGVAVDGNGDG